MILEQLTLRDFCIYGGEQTLDLAPGRRRGKLAPITLFGGINGGGKTTLLDAVQLVLYGVRARCSKRADKPYDVFLRESIHHAADPREGAAIRLSFRYAAEGQEHLYEVARAWSEWRGRIRESVRVRRNGEEDGWLSENWNQLVEELIPFGIAQLCFFDAEKIRFLADDETSTQALGDAIKSLLGLDLAERLVADAAVLEGRIAKRVERSPELQEVEQLEEDVEQKQTQIDRVVQELGSLENPRLAARQRLAAAEQQFSKAGGQHWEQREARQRELVEAQQAVKSAEEQLVDLAATDLPLALVADLLGNVAQQARQEQEAAEAQTVAGILADRDEALLEVLKAKRVAARSIKIVENFTELDRTRRTTVFEVDGRLRLSESGGRLAEHLLERGIDERVRAAKDLLTSAENGRRQKEGLQRALAAVPEEASVQEVAAELKAAARELATLDQKVARFEKQLVALRTERSQLESQLARLRRKVVDEQICTEESARIAQLLVRTQNTMTTFLRKATHSKIDRLSRLISESFRFLLRKKTLVERVQIDPETFSITLYDDTGRTVSKRRLSEGEKQIFAISVLWGLSRASARPLPSIIDTPMARLDAQHRSQLVQRYFPHASHQVIILSTDTEIDRRYYQQLQPLVARAYHLNYSEKQKLTVAEEGYFWDPEPVMETEEAVA